MAFSLNSISFDKKRVLWEHNSHFNPSLGVGGGGGNFTPGGFALITSKMVKAVILGFCCIQ